MSDPNPYASPRSDLEPEVRKAQVGAWRCGDYLVMHRAATLPPICVFTGQEAAGSLLELDFTGPGDRYHFRLVYEPLSATLRVPVNREFQASYHWKTWLLLTSIVVGAGLGIAFALAVRFSPVLSVMCLVASAAAFIVAAIVTVNRPTLALYDLNADYIWLRGACPEFLGHLPDWPFRGH